ncbi:uncharacterized protein IL334_006163 [Kwoniella shivajii]|uniref:ribonuclease Z n=1 Tax=Kwoniella shivajii TaxID=564305 RepID=A0ABZ1D6R5_9TREE|nr:hypothetical protein IL334_006163 [Kwoniella shivajii]
MAHSNESHQPNWHVKALSVPGPDTDLSLHVSFDNARFLFGCGEGTQRAFVQKRMGMRGLSGIFIGSGEAKARNGLAGVLMTAADGGISKVDVIGPPDMSHYVSTLRTSVIRDSLTVNMHSFPRDKSPGESVELFKSANITVHGIALIPQPDAESSTSLNVNLDPYNPSFRPSRLSPEDTQKWCDTIVGDMFHNGPAARSSRKPNPSSPRRSPLRTVNPFINPDGTICSSIPDTRYPLPVPTREDVETQMVYICQAPDVRGKFDVEKANKLGVPKGPMRGKLTRGEEIEVDDPSIQGGKRIVKPEQCLVGGGPGSVLIVVNCSDKTKSALLENPIFRRYQYGDEGETAHAHLIVHRVPRSIWESEDYQEWMRAFGERTQHLIADPVEYPDRTVFNSAAWNTLQLSLVNSSIFTPPFVISPNVPSSKLPPRTSFLVEGSSCRMHPPSDFTTVDNHEKDVPFLITASEADSARETIRRDMPEYAQACDIAQKALLADPRSTNPSPPIIGDDITVTTLGTGSAIPSKYRNVSSTHLDIPGLGGILLDAGEGTLGQMRRRYGKDGLKKLFEDLKMIFISHMHADHHLGLHAILEDRFRQGISSPLYVIGPHSIALGMQESASWQYPASREALDNVFFINIGRLGYKVENKGYTDGSIDEAGAEMDQWEKEASDDRDSGRRGWPFNCIYGFSPAANRDHWQSINRLMRDLSFVSIWAPVVPHRGRAYGLAIEHSSGWKIVYSGDTKPSEELVQAGRNATLLIHEATLEDDKPDVAAVKGHSTFSQAIDVGKKMSAKHILLNHFSQRYPKLPKLPVPIPNEDGSAEAEAQPVVSISFDFMSVKLSEMWKMSYYMEPLSLLFAEAEEEDGTDQSGNDTLGQVKRDINPSVDGVIGKPIPKKGNKHNGDANGGGNGAQEGKSKKSLKKEAARNAKRAASPSSNHQPEPKRRSTDSSSINEDTVMDVTV